MDDLGVRNRSFFDGVHNVGSRSLCGNHLLWCHRLGSFVLHVILLLFLLNMFPLESLLGGVQRHDVRT